MQLAPVEPTLWKWCLRRLELLDRVAGGADPVPRSRDLHVVRVVAIGAGDAVGEHPALQERLVLVHLVLDLAVGVVKTWLEKDRPVRVRERLSIHVVGRDDRPARVAPAAHLDLGPGLARHAAFGEAGFRVDDPGGLLGLAQDEGEPLVRIVLLRPAGPDLLAPRGVGRPRPVTGLAGDVDLREGRLVAVLLRMVALRHVGRVALGAHEVPVLIRPGPVKRVAVRHLFLRVEVEPALPALLRRPGVPADVQGLVPAARKRDQVLLQREGPEGVGDRVLPELPVRPVGANEELAVALEERGRDAEMREARVLEVPDDRFLAGLLHGEVVVRAVPPPRLLRVAFLARRPAHEGRGRSRRRPPLSAEQRPRRLHRPRAGIPPASEGEPPRPNRAESPWSVPMGSPRGVQRLPPAPGSAADYLTSGMAPASS